MAKSSPSRRKASSRGFFNPSITACFATNIAGCGMTGNLLAPLDRPFDEVIARQHGIHQADSMCLFDLDDSSAETEFGPHSAPDQLW